MRPIGPKPANAGVSWPYGGVRMPVAGSKPPMSNCVPPHGKREGVLCFRLVKDRPPKRATGLLAYFKNSYSNSVGTISVL